jgi:hypothetical protein
VANTNNGEGYTIFPRQMRILSIIYQAVLAEGETTYRNNSKRQIIPMDDKGGKEL